MQSVSSLLLLDSEYKILKRQDFPGTEYLVIPIFSYYSMKYFQRDLFKESDYSYLEGLETVMGNKDYLVKQFFDEKLLLKNDAVTGLKYLIEHSSLPKLTFLRLSGYLQFLESNDGIYVLQQNSSDYPDIDNKIENGKFLK